MTLNSKNVAAEYEITPRELVFSFIEIVDFWLVFLRGFFFSIIYSYTKITHFNSRRRCFQTIWLPVSLCGFAICAYRVRVWKYWYNLVDDVCQLDGEKKSILICDTGLDENSVFFFCARDECGVENIKALSQISNIGLLETSDGWIGEHEG